MSNLTTTNFSAIEIQSPTDDFDAKNGIGGIVFDGMTSAQGDEIGSGTIPDGYLTFFTDTGEFAFRQSNAWVALGGISATAMKYVGEINPPQYSILTTTVSGVGSKAAVADATLSPGGDLELGGNLLVTEESLFKNGVVMNEGLNVDGALSPYSSTAAYTYATATQVDIVGNANPLMVNPTILCNGPLVSTSLYTVTSIAAMSSKNIKKVIDSEDKDAKVLELFKKLSFKEYKYKDPVKYSNGTYYGVIAEEVKEVLPHLIADYKDFAPNIMRAATIESTKVGENESFEYRLSFNDNNKLDTVVTEGMTIGILDDKGKNSTTVKAIDENSWTVESKEELKGLIYVYGTLEDCPFVAKEQIFEMNALITQNLIKQIEVQAKQIEFLMDAIKRCENAKKV